MLNVTVSYKGKNFDSIESASAAAIADGMKDIIEKKIEPFRGDVEKENGKLEIEITYTNMKDVSAQLVATDLSDELVEKVRAAIHQD